MAINIRVSAQTKDLIDKAADLQGKSRSEFILDSARARAVDVLLDQRLFTLEPEAFAAFERVLSEVPAPVAKLSALLRNPSPWER